MTVTGRSGTRQLEQSDPVPGSELTWVPSFGNTTRVCVRVKVPTTSFKYKHSDSIQTCNHACTLTCHGHSLRPHRHTCPRLVGRARGCGCCRRGPEDGAGSVPEH